MGWCLATLGRDAGDPATLYLYLAAGMTVCRFRGVELAPEAIVVDGIAAVAHGRTAYLGGSRACRSVAAE